MTLGWERGVSLALLYLILVLSIFDLLGQSEPSEILHWWIWNGGVSKFFFFVIYFLGCIITPMVTVYLLSQYDSDSVEEDEPTQNSMWWV